MSPISVGCLYIVATPIGNLEDISQRALNTLKSVDLILAEDTRHSKRLLDNFNINTPMLSYHAHNENNCVKNMGNRLLSGQKIALISDAGMPLISDPGFPLVRFCHEHDVPLLVIPGPSALISALSASGLPANSFVFYGFLPAKPTARQEKLRSLIHEEKTSIFFESTHRLMATLKELDSILPEREMCLAKEISKPHEAYIKGPANTLYSWLNEEKDRKKGEFVLIISGCDPLSCDKNNYQILEKLLKYLPIKPASKLCAELTTIDAKDAYKLALNIKKSTEM